MKRRRRCLDLTPTEHPHHWLPRRGGGRKRSRRSPGTTTTRAPYAPLLLELSPGLLILPRRFPKRFASSTRSRSETIISFKNPEKAAACDVALLIMETAGTTQKTEAVKPRGQYCCCLMTAGPGDPGVAQRPVTAAWLGSRDKPPATKWIKRALVFQKRAPGLDDN